MKALLFTCLFCYGIGVLVPTAHAAESPEDRRKDLFLLSIKDSVHKEEALRASDLVESAQGGVSVEAEMKKMFAIDDPAVKLATIAWSRGSFDTRRRMAQELKLHPKDLPLVLTWVFLEPAGSTFDDWSIKASTYANLELFAKEAGKILGREMEIMKFKPLTPDREWESYTEEVLRSWSIAQIQTSLDTKRWSESDSAILNDLLKKLQTGTRNFLLPSPATSEPPPPPTPLTSSPAPAAPLAAKPAPPQQSRGWVIGSGVALGILVLLLFLRRTSSR